MKRTTHKRSRIRYSRRRGKFHLVCTVCGERLPRRLGGRSYVTHVKKYHTAKVYE